MALNGIRNERKAQAREFFSVPRLLLDIIFVILPSVVHFIDTLADIRYSRRGLFDEGNVVASWFGSLDSVPPGPG